MLKLHEDTQRRVCRILFVTLCVIPLLCVLAWCAARQSDSEIIAWQAQAGSVLQLATACEGLTHVRPNVTLLHEVSGEDYESKEPFFQTRLLEIDGQSNGLHVVAHQPTLHGSGMRHFADWLCRQMTQGEQQWTGDWQLTAKEVSFLPQSATALTFNDLALKLSNARHAAEGALSVRLAGANSQEPITIRLVRQHESSSPRWSVHFDTALSSIPCSLLGPWLSITPGLGSAATFDGAGWAELRDDGWRSEFNGVISQASLDRLISDRFPHRLTGTATLRIRRAVIEQGKVVVLEGAVDARDGTISRSLLESARQQMKLGDGADPLPRQEEEVAYAHLAFDFSIDASGIRLSGACQDGKDPRSMLISADGRDFWFAPRGTQPIPVANLLRALLLHQEMLIPAVRETPGLLRLFPLPEVVASEDAIRGEAVPNGKLRMRSTQ